MLILDGAKIKERRERMVMTQEEIAAKNGISVRGWSMAENGQSVGVSVARRVAAALNLKPDAIIKEVINVRKTGEK